MNGGRSGPRHSYPSTDARDFSQGEPLRTPLGFTPTRLAAYSPSAPTVGPRFDRTSIRRVSKLHFYDHAESRSLRAGHNCLCQFHRTTHRRFSCAVWVHRFFFFILCFVSALLDRLCLSLPTSVRQLTSRRAGASSTLSRADVRRFFSFSFFFRLLTEFAASKPPFSNVILFDAAFTTSPQAPST